MGKNLIQQRRGKGSPTFRVPSFRFQGKASYPTLDVKSAVVVDLVRDALHSAPLAKVVYDNGKEGLLIAPEGIKVKDKLFFGEDAPLDVGNVLPLKAIPEGTLIYNIEVIPGDGGKLVRASGLAARIISKSEKEVIVELPSKRKKSFNPNCRATIGVVAGGGRKAKPFVKAGNKYKAMKAKNHYYPKVKGISMNAVAHPHGGKRSSHLGRPDIAPKNAPPGRKVGKLRPKRTGRRKR